MRIEIQDISFTYGNHQVLEGTTFHVSSGKFVGIIGPNGSGKTTLLKVLSRILQPTAGCVRIGEQSLSELTQKELARTMAVVSQDTNVGYQFSVEDVVLMGRAPYLGRFQSESLADYEIARHALEVTGCTHLRDRSILELSGGERQRVTIARALAQQPKVLLLDEPTSHLDIGYQQEILDLVKRLSTVEGLTVVAVLHDLNLAAYFCHELVLMHQGKILACGQPTDVLTADNIEKVYATRVLVTPHPVFGTPQISLLPGTREQNKHGENHQIHVIAGGGSGGEIMRDLCDAGYKVTAGVLSVGDSDWEAARALSIPVISEAPFSSVSPERHQENLAMLETAQAVILTEIPLGHGNLLNLEAALQAAAAGKPVYMIEEKPAQNRDFTGGPGQELLTKVQQQAQSIREKTELYRALAEQFSSSGQLNDFTDVTRPAVDQ
ncbi:MAG TPA: heme ABC transporter ATP-binding protein [Oscillospiraceae bacterium]|nr:heme ABC transporter ATP-binding protein [Oscillospiraceae bacterium]